MSTKPIRDAESKGVVPSSRAWLTAALASRSSATTSECPIADAKSSAEVPSSCAWFTTAPPSINARTTSTWPRPAAMISGVVSSCRAWFTAALARSSVRTTSEWPSLAALKRGDMPSSPAWFTDAPASRSSTTTWTCPSREAIASNVSPELTSKLTLIPDVSEFRTPSTSPRHAICSNPFMMRAWTMRSRWLPSSASLRSSSLTSSSLGERAGNEERKASITDLMARLGLAPSTGARHEGHVSLAARACAAQPAHTEWRHGRKAVLRCIVEIHTQQDIASSMPDKSA
mmetsp:Transcript_65457/g.149914  ORF Transcript_65457/g.149914 Transcript_65457/m.149914 type:complete len:287 (-) Transcript_65457:60-920(-)